jgi:hypothetical protein
MNTGNRCTVCNLPILTNQIIVGFPIIRITGINQSAMTGDEFLIHAGCFTKRMYGEENHIIQLNGKNR